MQNSFVSRYSLGSPEELYRRVNEPTWHIVCGVTWLKCASDSGYEQIPTDTGGSIRRGTFHGVVWSFAKPATRSKSIEATWTGDETIVLSRSIRGSASSANSASKRIDNNSAEAASAKDLTLWTLDGFPAWQSLPLIEPFLRNISVNISIEACMTFNNIIGKFRVNLRLTDA